MLDSALDWLGSKGAPSFLILGTMIGYTSISAFMGWKSGVDDQLAAVAPMVEKVDEIHDIVKADHDRLIRVETKVEGIEKTVEENKDLGKRFREAQDE